MLSFVVTEKSRNVTKVNNRIHSFSFSLFPFSFSFFSFFTFVPSTRGDVCVDAGAEFALVVRTSVDFVEVIFSVLSGLVGDSLSFAPGGFPGGGGGGLRFGSSSFLIGAAVCLFVVFFFVS